MGRQRELDNEQLYGQTERIIRIYRWMDRQRELYEFIDGWKDRENSKMHRQKKRVKIRQKGRHIVRNNQTRGQTERIR